MKTDATGNIYITGLSINKMLGCDIMTIKYDTQGNEIWVSRFNSNPNRLGIEDVPYDIDIDEESNLYITGYDKSGFSKDIITLKMDSNGNILWTAKYQGNGGGDNIATAIAVDNIDNAYITGYAYNLGTDYDYTTIKYNTGGQMLWVKTYNGAGNYQDFANDIALDKYADVYITGKSNSRIKSYISDSTSEIVTSKYSIKGDSIWTARYSKGSTNNGIEIKTDNKDNVYVLGYINPINIARSYILIKYAQRRY
jgi:lambda repressor-like predicted transcriptional regulator